MATRAETQSLKRVIPQQPEVNIGTVGHVDHGKTTLVKGITGIWTSEHSEELRRGITIKVGYADAAFYRCAGCPPPTCYTATDTCPKCGEKAELLRVVSFVDTPGHESLMAIMLSGAAVMNGAILTIAANEPVPQPQTREHLLALQMLGMKHIVIAQNKLDLVDDGGAERNYQEIKRFVKGTVAEDAPIIPVSGQHKLNIDALIGAIQEYIPTPKRHPEAKPLMQTLRSFDVNRPGMLIPELRGGVVGGTLTQGEFKVGDEVEIVPGLADEKSGKYMPIRTEIISIGTSAGLVDRVGPGGLVALGTKLDPALTRADALLGSVIGLPDELPPVHNVVALDTQLFKTAVGAPDMAKVEPIRPGEALRLNVGTGVTLGPVKSVKGNRVEVELKRPVCAAPGSRVALTRRIGDRWRLIGSGTIL
ncbi:MAG: translation initiation factor IF-2 subunit gamma [Thaumarchaeota archaeon]|nr:translation initiation factor IF-2 subunit gamma [Nitrososphaerota archaeon]